MRAALACIAVWFLSATGAQAAPLPRYESGQAFIFDNGRVEQVRDVRGDKVVWGARSGRSYLRHVNPVVPILEWSFRGQTGTRSVIGDPGKLWPLEAGRRVQFRTLNISTERDRRARRSVHLWTCTVQGARRISVPAGLFQAYPIQCDRFSPNSMRVLERLTWHYAPEVDHYIRREARDMNDGTSESYSLFAALPPKDANPIRIEALALRARGGRDGVPTNTQGNGRAKRSPRTR